jgi:hypothetical protein
MQLLLKKKDFELQTMEGLLAEAEAKIARLNSELLSKSESFEQEKQKFDMKFEAEVERSSNLQKSLKELQDKCLEFGNRCVQRLKQVFNSVGASSEKFDPSVEDLPGTFEHIECEVDALDEVIAGHDDFLSSGSCICLKALANMIPAALPVSTRTLWTRNPLMTQDMTITSL